MDSEERREAGQAQELTPAELERIAGGQEQPKYSGTGHPIDRVCPHGHALPGEAGSRVCPECGEFMELRFNDRLNQKPLWEQLQDALRKELQE